MTLKAILLASTLNFIFTLRVSFFFDQHLTYAAAWNDFMVDSIGARVNVLL
jgi:hypothetical protein